MRRITRILLYAGMLCAVAGPEPASGAAVETKYRVRWTEPSTDAEDRPLGDLASCTVRVWDSVLPAVRKLVNQETISASGLSGAAVRSVVLTASANTLEKGKAVSATCVDMAGNESAESNAIALDFRRIPPARVTDLSAAIDVP